MKKNININFKSIRIFFSETSKNFLNKIPSFSLLCLMIIIIVISIDYVDYGVVNSTKFWRLVPETCAVIYFSLLFYFFIIYSLYSFAIKFFGLERIYLPNKKFFQEILKSIFVVNSKELKNWNKKNNKFDTKNPKYRLIKNTNIILFFIFFNLEAFFYALGEKNASGWPLLIYFIWARESIRRRFKINPDFENKLVFTFIVWLFVSSLFFISRLESIFLN
tara:strand:- start:29 stop:688 length:660 start_codon:yes stop_codon:yes gene_type:complete